jgi:hypothetical protein
MAMVSCSQGHWYDNADHSRCPYCNTNNGVAATVPVGVTTPVGGASANIGATLPVFPAGNPAPGSYGTYPSDEGKTMPLIREDIGIDPVVGWLICTNGKDRGKDYRVHADNNFIGRDSTMDICISGDETISRENHAIISYDTRDKMFYLAPGAGRSIVRHNGKPVLMAIEIKAYDDIELGQSKLKFIPFCGEKFDWLDI